MRFTIEPSTQDMLRILKRRAKDELVTNGAAYEELVDDLIAEKLEWGELDQDEDTVGMREKLVQRWPEVEEHVRESAKELPIE